MNQELYVLSLVFSCIALIVSGVTAWLTFFRKGKLLMSQPTVIFLGPDGSLFDSGKNKVYLRTLLFSTAKRGQVIESIHVSLQRHESKQNFNIWVYGDKGELKRGSGLYVPQEGVTFDHHFLLPADGVDFVFLAGSYRLMVFAKLVGNPMPEKLSEISLVVSESQAESLSQPNRGLYFDWGPDQQTYYAHIKEKPEKEANIEDFLKVISNKSAQLTD
ncbi:hypothetical protein [Vibrio hepatarius]|uniref:hypothetical protein n=1 Tax=Vibrio hepatarius TaxID=171383 RepID=UPI001C0991C5|nr:hypothetical protein [Vibrio hepatarius]MBU2896484.1 hypothetical protein [Vibrio hepatarius]